MKYSLPMFYEEIHPYFRKYFSKKYFDGKTHYPQTIADANNYVLFDIYKVDKIKSFKINIVDENEETEERKFVYPHAYKACFKYENWSKLSVKQKVVALYWICEEIKKELKTPPRINFCFITYINSIGCYRHSYHVNDININPVDLIDSKISAFDFIDTLAHELRHSTFLSIDHDNYMNKRNQIYYYKYEPSDDAIENSYNYAMYYFQPTELDALRFGMNYSYDLFVKVNPFGKPDFEDLNYFANVKNQYRHNTKLGNIMFKDKYKEHLDLYYLLDEFKNDLTNPKLSLRKQKKIMEAIEEVQRNIDNEKAAAMQNLLNSIKNQATVNINKI